MRRNKKSLLQFSGHIRKVFGSRNLGLNTGYDCSLTILIFSESYEKN